MVIGIDPDVQRLAYAAFRDGALVVVQTIPRTNTTGRFHERYDAALTTLMRRASDLGAVVYLEDIFLPADRDTANVRAFRALAEVQGEVKRAARLYSVPVVNVAASTWRSPVLGVTKGREALKRAAQAKAEAMAGRELTEHESEAVCIGLYGVGVEAERGEIAV